MIGIRRGDERGRTRIGWLDSAHTFSFGGYHDPAHMGFGVLRVINEDRVEPGRGFDPHGHRDMEILSYVVDGALAHRDSIGNGSVIRVGELQRMSAGTGVTHSEYNESGDRLVHFLQIWIVPERRNVEPSYEQHAFSDEEKRDRLRLVASRDGREGSLTVHQDVNVYLGAFGKDARVTHRLPRGRDAWLQVVRGNVELNGGALAAGDGAAVTAEEKLDLLAVAPAEVLLFDLPPSAAT